MDGVDFFDLVSSVQADTVEGKKVRPRKPNCYKKSPNENFTKKEAAATRSLVYPSIKLLFRRKNGIFYSIFFRVKAYLVHVF